MAISEMFDPKLKAYGHWGAPRWCQEVFKRAYCHDESASFADVVRKLRAGFSVLVQLPGPCMTAAAEHVVNEIPTDWHQFGRFERDTDVVSLWEKTTGIFERLTSWFDGSSNRAPQAIYHNLDLLADDRGGMYGHTFAHNALFSLLEMTRTGTVLGLADLFAGELPSRAASCFTEVVTLREIPLAGFRAILPMQLGRSISSDRKTVDESQIRLLWARLRWGDPVQAVRLMFDVANSKSSFKSVLSHIAAQTRPVDYLPSENLPNLDQEIDGYDREVTRNDIENLVIAPYRRLVEVENNAFDPKFANSLRSRMPLGVILHGPPGTGKTTLGRWIAKEIGWPIKVVSAAEIRRPGFGDAERLVRKTFYDARRAAPCVLVLDDADDLLPARSSVSGATASADVGIVNALLQELEGFNGVLEGVLVILTTNRFESIDPAIRQRLSLHVAVPYPLTDQQIRKIVQVTADRYGFALGSGVEDRLAEVFYGYAPTDSGEKEKNKTRLDRLRCRTSLFSPRSIARAMLHLNPEDGFHVSMGDVEKMENYIRRQIESRP